MASPNAVFTEIVSTTLRAHRRRFADNVSNHNALLMRMNRRGRKRVLAGGYEIVEPLDYDENSTWQRYSGYDVLNVAASDVLSAAAYPWRQAAVHVTANGLELRQNSGREAMIDLVKSRVTNAMRTFRNNISRDVYSDGTAPNQANGLQALISDLGTGTVGGINSTNFPFWRNVVQSAAAPLQGGGAITPSATTIESLMLPLWLELTRGSDIPDIIVMSNDYFTFYETSQTSLKRYAPMDDGQGGMLAMKYKQADVFHDGGSGIPDAHAYFINTDFLNYVTHRDADMQEVPEQRSINQDAVVIPVIHQYNLTCSNRALQGVMTA